MRFRVFIAICLVPLLSGMPILPALSQTLSIGAFSQGDLSGWEEQSFVGNTRYELVQDEQRQVLQADTVASASGLYFEREIDLSQTPYLNWSWKVDNVYSGNDEKTRQGDDYPARIFVVVSGGLFFWKTKAINYAWTSQLAAGSTWESAVTRNAVMLSLHSGNRESGQWLSEKRNIREDFRELFGEDVVTIHAIAIMSDSDNTGQRARAYYGDIYFSED